MIYYSKQRLAALCRGSRIRLARFMAWRSGAGLAFGLPFCLCLVVAGALGGAPGITPGASAQTQAPTQSTVPAPQAIGQQPAQMQGPVVTIWHPHQVRLQYRQQTLSVPQWQLQPVWAQQSLPYLQPTFKKVTALTYRPRLVLEPVEMPAWQLQWQKQQRQQAMRVWQPQMRQQQVQLWYPQWQVVTPTRQ